MTHCTEDTVVSGVFVCISGSDGSERCGREMVNASTGCVYVRQVGSSCAYHHYRLCPALYRYVYTLTPPCTLTVCLPLASSSALRTWPTRCFAVDQDILKGQKFARPAAS